MQRIFTQDWLYSFWIAIVCSGLPFISHGKLSDECTWRRMSLPSRNLYKCKQVACNVIVTCLFVYPLFLYCTLLLLVYFFFPYFVLILLLYFCLLVSHGNTLFIIVFVYHFKNNISIFVTQYSESMFLNLLHCCGRHLKA